MRDTIARRSDVDADSIKYDVEPGTKSYRLGTVTFAAKKGQSIDLWALQADLKKTRLGKGTRSAVNYLETTIAGEIVAVEKETLLKATGTHFVLADDPKAQPKDGKKTAYQRLVEAVKKGDKIESVTGRVQGWSGVWPKALGELSKQMADVKKSPELLVTNFVVVQP
ncbi:MAG: hypothetical protein L0215_05905 [Gemmataceae bacterium]|nr:hypothetical protein [Gemmataceae bacterium]